MHGLTAGRVETFPVSHGANRTKLHNYIQRIARIPPLSGEFGSWGSRREGAATTWQPWDDTPRRFGPVKESSECVKSKSGTLGAVATVCPVVQPGGTGSILWWGQQFYRSLRRSWCAWWRVGGWVTRSTFWVPIPIALTTARVGPASMVAAYAAGQA